MAPGDKPLGRRRWAIGVVTVLVAVGTAVVASLLLSADADPTQLEQARALVADDSGFGTGLEGGETLARVAQHLEHAVETCRRDERGTSCQALAAALGYALVLAPRVLDCTDPGRHEARTRMADYLDTVERVESGARRVPGPPPLPECRA